MRQLIELMNVERNLCDTQEYHYTMSSDLLFMNHLTIKLDFLNTYIAQFRVFSDQIVYVVCLIPLHSTLQNHQPLSIQFKIDSLYFRPYSNSTVQCRNNRGSS